MREHQQQLNDILHSSQESNGIPGMNKMTKNYCPHNLTVKILNFIVFISWSLNIILITGLISFSDNQEQHPIIALMNSAVQRSSATAAPAAAGRPADQLELDETAPMTGSILDCSGKLTQNFFSVHSCVLLLCKLASWCLDSLYYKYSAASLKLMLY